MRKLLILLILCINFTSIYAADENITADSTVDGNIINNGGNVTVKGDNTLQQGDINAEAGDNVVIDNDDCLKYPDKCKKEVTTSEAPTPTIAPDDTANMNSADATNSNATNMNSAPITTQTSAAQDMSKLPKTGPAENVLILMSLVAGALFVFRKKLFKA